MGAPPKPRARKAPPGPPAWFHLGSLQRRLVLAALVFITAALVVAGLAIGLILHRFVRGQLDSRLDSQIVALVSGLQEGPDGSPRLDRDRDGPPFDRPRSGWYWQVTRGGQILRSRSLRDGVIDLDGSPEGGDERPRPAEGRGPRGEALILRVLTLPGPGQPTTILAAAPAAALQGPVRDALATLALALAVLGLCLMAGVAVQVRLGLRPLERLRGDLAEVRSGRRTRVPPKQPAEVRPLVAEINGLLDQNEANLERARMHVANLAHGLKTPLATLSLALANRPEPEAGLAGVVAAMDRQVRHHLRRARAAALGGPVRTRTELVGRVGDLAAALGRIHAAKAPTIAIDIAPGLAVTCDPQDLDEMLGNLIDNACQWCRSRVRVSAVVDAPHLHVLVEDDGPGLDAAARAEVLRHGLRLDESVPGNGFGLSITLELAELYGGGLALEPSDLGGLRARLRLPA
ncbi:sensor histidine kinase [Methylobacterium soli]|uniref:histidine kinase n=1 Tax=Methylobacterium soli TaxID=553447 RepID=A0A6L3SZI4_9HYPH|nr:ATP-binding protein [Methylobacterium soli]KAB1079508.1 sensor histidine kinase [Methylobacterium soli]GJE43770.1 Adaptive-response sensory-kinase SasA [Methylobacterium soli]